MIDPTPEQIEGALGYIDKTIDNCQDLPADLAWANSEVLEMLAQVRAELMAAAGAAPQEPNVRAAREFLEAALAESDADEKDPDGGSGWDVDVDARTVLDLLAEAASVQVDEAKLDEVVQLAVTEWLRLQSAWSAEGKPYPGPMASFIAHAAAEWLRGGGQ